MRHAEPWETPLEIRLMDLITRVLLGVVIGGACIVGVIWFLGQSRFDITSIEVQNEMELKRVDVVALKQVTMSRLNGNFFTLKLNDVKNMLETMPWVKEATIQRVWPYQLNVTVREHEPVAFWGKSQTGVRLLNADGEIFEVSHQVFGLKLPVLSGPEEKGAASYMWQFYLQMALEMNALNMRIDELRLSDHGIWSMRLDNGAEVMIGRGNLSELSGRVHDFVLTVPAALRPYGGRALIRADLRYPNGYAMEIAGVQTEVSVAGSQTRVH